MPYKIADLDQFKNKQRLNTYVAYLIVKKYTSQKSVVT